MPRRGSPGARRPSRGTPWRTRRASARCRMTRYGASRATGSRVTSRKPEGCRWRGRRSTRLPVGLVLERARGEHQVVPAVEAGRRRRGRWTSGFDSSLLARATDATSRQCQSRSTSGQHGSRDRRRSARALRPSRARRFPARPVRGAGEDIGERDEHVVGGHVVGGETLARARLVIDAERARALERCDPLGPLGEVGLGDRTAVPARRLAAPSPRGCARTRAAPAGSGAGSASGPGTARRRPIPAERAFHGDHEDRRRHRLGPPSARRDGRARPASDSDRPRAPR